MTDRSTDRVTPAGVDQATAARVMRAAAEAPGDGTTDQHVAAVARTLSWADEAAASGDYAEALAWLATVEAVGDALTGAYLAKRREWRRLAGRAPARSQSARHDPDSGSAEPG